MKKLTVILFFLFCAPIFAYCQNDSGALTLTIKLDKTIYKTGEPINIEYQIVNSSDNPVSIDPPFSDEGMIDPNYFSGTFFIQRQGDNNSTEVFPLADIDWMRARSIEIAAHASYKRKVNIIGMIENGKTGEVAYSTNLFLYKEGSYRVTAKFIPRLIRSACWSKALESNVVFITIKEKKYISEDEALRIAKKACSQSGWEWTDIKLKDMASEEQYIVMTHASKRDGHAEIYIDKKSGRVLQKFRKG